MLVPVFAGDNVQPSVLINVSHGDAFAAAKVDGVFAERDFVRTCCPKKRPVPEERRCGKEK